MPGSAWAFFQTTAKKTVFHPVLAYWDVNINTSLPTRELGGRDNLEELCSPGRGGGYSCVSGLTRSGSARALPKTISESGRARFKFCRCLEPGLTLTKFCSWNLWESRMYPAVDSY